MPKKQKGGPFGIFQHPFRRKTSKIEGEPFREKILIRQKVSLCRKN